MFQSLTCFSLNQRATNSEEIDYLTDLRIFNISPIFFPIFIVKNAAVNVCDGL